MYYSEALLTDNGADPHFPLPAAFAASSSSIKRTSSGVCLTFSLLTVTKPSDTKASVIFCAEQISKRDLVILIVENEFHINHLSLCKSHHIHD